MQQPNLPRRQDASGATDARTDAWVSGDDSNLSGPDRQVMPEFLDATVHPNRSEPAVGTNATGGRVVSGTVPATAGASSTLNQPPPGAVIDTPYQPNPRTDASYSRDEEGSGGIPILGLSVGSVAMTAAVAAAGWWYVRWQRERNRPVNRLRRTMRSWTSELSGRMPEMPELPTPDVDRRVGGGIGTGLLLVSMVALKALMGDDKSRGEKSRDDTGSLIEKGMDGASKLSGDTWQLWQRRGIHPEFSTQPLRAASRDVLRMASAGASRGASTLGKGRHEVAGIDMPGRSMGMGLGGVLAIAAAAYLGWRALRGDRQEHVHVHTSAWDGDGSEHTHAHAHD